MFTSSPYPKAQLVKTFEDEVNTLLLDEKNGFSSEKNYISNSLNIIDNSMLTKNTSS